MAVGGAGKSGCQTVMKGILIQSECFLISSIYILKHSGRWSNGSWRLCSAHKIPPKGSSGTAVIGSSGDTLSPRVSLCLQTPGVVTAVCWHAYVPSTMPRLFRLPHLSQDMFITHRSQPKINVGTTHPGWVMNPSLPASDGRVCFFPFFSPPRLVRALHIPVPPRFTPSYQGILVNKAARSQSPNCDSRGRRITLPDGVLMSPWISRCSDPS